MIWDLTAATAYIRFNSLDNEDFIDAEPERQTALLNVASRTLTRKYSAYTIPNEAVYLFATALGAAFNDTNKMAKQGITSFSFEGIAFKFGAKAALDLEALIPAEVIDLIGAENGTKIPTGRVVKWTVM